MGDTVWSYDHQLQRPVLQKVLYPIMGEWHYVADISLQDGSTLSATYDHPFYANGQWLAAGQLQAGDTLYSYIYDEATGPEQRANVVAGVQLRDTVVTVYNFGVAGTHTFYAGEQGVLVHNCAVQDVIAETNSALGKRNITSKHALTENEVLEAGTQFIGKNHKELGPNGSGVYRSNVADANGNFKQFRMDDSSLARAHQPNVPHVHLDVISPNNALLINNHILLK